MLNSHPKVSICVPNLNTRTYLPERFETIFNQTLQEFVDGAARLPVGA